ncbi:hypothetical protein LBBP_01660 [Leptospira borgpetersenii serovar Ballum]|uniref:Uncharacterized protein n=1 Tax=Leptospira borgpetersenii serovar Ballum TaxID=280505 RepID=A0A0S2IQK8_LEPBO|nr:hypothetical protein LBBP_01660 [Leptospira borgpetersenii serovar Ballum]EMN13143.1 hypothetical protein LEP1GSC055_3050 [Leptospira borgpetersenii str. Brem 307]
MALARSEGRMSDPEHSGKRKLSDARLQKQIALSPLVAEQKRK